MVDSAHKHLAHLAAFNAEPVVFFTVVTAGRRAVLACAEAYDVLRGLWERSAQANQWWVGDYLLMPDHVHFFARAGRGADTMKNWVQMWKSVSARMLLKRLRLGPPFWQEDYFDRYLRSSENYSDKWAYVQANPVRAGLVAQTEDWLFRGRIHDLRF
ncbi:MAG: hypothetical protein GX548_11770 [Lentisphaerae bacterium]|nr:hypothetical protein [Lentisphaerota bacterium]